jgi:predicted enzyme involved in methoxymalonyl-ACP biosynthesis
MLMLQLRLIDQFGDYGIIGMVIGKPEGDDISDMRIDTWLVSERDECMSDQEQLSRVCAKSLRT